MFPDQRIAQVATDTGTHGAGDESRERLPVLPAIWTISRFGRHHILVSPWLTTWFGFVSYASTPSDDFPYGIHPGVVRVVYNWAWTSDPVSTYVPTAVGQQSRGSGRSGYVCSRSVPSACSIGWGTWDYSYEDFTTTRTD
ncbi:hypothetical protein R1flu_004544 [Riccia fluitans]|uniref:Uncharacterized protein n=1 Tax=Riccia fluitans TaxID=41844 RepID=A0ABD1YQM4_9MARC